MEIKKKYNKGSSLFQANLILSFSLRTTLAVLSKLNCPPFNHTLTPLIYSKIYKCLVNLLRPTTVST